MSSSQPPLSSELVIFESEATTSGSGIGGGITGAIGRLVRFGAETTIAATENVVEAVVGSKTVQDSVDRVMNGAAMESALSALLEGPFIDNLAREIARRQVIQRITVEAIEAGEIAPIIDALLAREELWVLVQEIAESPAVSEAVRQQSFGFADQVGDEVRGRSRSADDILARAARRLVGRRGAMSAQRPSDQDAHIDGESDRAEAANGGSK